MAVTLFQAVHDAVIEVRTELLIFIIALCTHAVLFGSYRWKPTPAKKASKDTGNSDKARLAAQIPGAPALIRSAKQLLRQGAGRAAMTEEIATQAKAVSSQNLCLALGSMLEAVGRNGSAELVVATRAVLKEQEQKPSQWLAEVLLRGCLAFNQQSDFDEVLAEVEAGEGATLPIAILALRSALRASDLDMAMGYLKRFAGPLTTCKEETASCSPQQIVQQLFHLAAKQGSIPCLVRELASCGFLTDWVVEAAIVESSSKTAAGQTYVRELEELARSKGVQLTDNAAAAVVRTLQGSADAARILAQSASVGTVGKELLMAVHESARTTRDASLAEAALKHTPASPLPDLAAVILHAFSEGPLRSKNRDSDVLGAYEKYLTCTDVLADSGGGRTVAEAALRQKRPEVLRQLMQAATDPRKQVALLKGFSTEHRLKEAKAVFEACPDKTVCLYNTLLDACIDCQDTDAAEKIMAEAVAADKADVVTYNTIIKKHLQRGNFDSARAVIEVMRSAGGEIAPNSVTFNELIDAAIRNDTKGVWVLFEEMKACGLRPNNVTCSILLKSIQNNSRGSDVEKVLSFVDASEDPMDEVLLSSVCEACIRANRSDLLAKHLSKQRGPKPVPINGAQTFGSVIRGYGYLRDMNGAWDAWQQMRRRKIVPTSITIGCMVEALVSNGNPQAGFDLIHELSSDEETKPLLNAIIYCSVLKGFTHSKAYDRVWIVYEEMMKEQLQFSIVTYNALIDACARAGEMSRVQSFLDDMAKQEIEPNLVTYSTILKGYCQENRLDKAFELLEAMKSSDQFMPDEITYNTLIDGCAQRGLYDQGVKLLEEMQNAGVAPSTFTLSVLVKLANRGKRPEKAFEFVDTLSKKYRLQPNVHVYANLVHACTAHGDLPRALEVFCRMAMHRIRPDLRTYTLLIRACITAGDLQEAVTLVHLAFGIRGAALTRRLAPLAGMEAGMRLRDGLPSDLITEVLQAATRWNCTEHLAVQLCKDLRGVPGLRLDPKVPLSLTSHVLRKPY